MASSPLSRIPPLALALLPCVVAQDSSGTAAPAAPSPPFTARDVTTGTPSSGNTMPSASDNAADNSNNSGKIDSDGLVNYYFVFIALILCIAGLGAFFVWRRRRRAIAQFQNGRQDALAQDLTAWDPLRSRRRYWQGRRYSAEVSREEGLNENGEAPPPYMPKTADEEARMGEDREDGPAVPMQTLAREDAGLKPPDYSEGQAQSAAGTAGRSSTDAGSSSRNT